MKPSEVKELKLGTPVWVWIVRFGTGRWWPGTVEGIEIEAIIGLPHIKVRFESFSPTRPRTDPPVTVGFVTARMRRLELRDINVEGTDRPRFVPTSVLRKPETLPLQMGCLPSHQTREDREKAAAQVALTDPWSRSTEMETGRCPLCWETALYGVIGHLRRDHRRSEIEARLLLERSNQGSLGWNAEGRKKGACLPLVPVKLSQASSVTDFLRFGKGRL